MAGDKVLLEQEYYSVGGGFIEWKGYKPPKKGAAEVSLLDDGGAAEARGDDEDFGRAARDGQRNGRLGQERGGDLRLRRQDHDGDGQHRQVRPRRCRQSVLPGPIKLKTKAGDVYKRAKDDKFEAQRGVGLVSAYALAGSEENARGHLVVTAPTGGSAGVMPALVYALGEGGTQAAAGEDSRRYARRRGGRLPLQAQRDALGRRRRLPGGDRRRFGDGRGVPRAGTRLSEPGRRQRRGIVAAASPRHDLRSGCRLSCRCRASSAARSAPSRRGPAS